MKSLFNLRGWPLPSFVPNLYFRFETDKLLAVKGWLVNQCCCFPPRFKCLKVGRTPCGQDEYKCVPDSSGEYRSEWECYNACPQTPPDPECSGCEECIDLQCVGACGPCELCNGDYCAPACSDCEQCIDGSCQSACGECEACVDGVCVPMDPCIPPDEKWYCCAEPSPPPESGMPTPPPVLRCQRGPCGRVEDGTWTEDPDLTYGGPYDSPQECGQKCRGHSCVPDGCNGNVCIASADNPQYNSWDECEESCVDTPTDICAAYQWPTPADICPCEITGSGPGTNVYKFGIDPDYTGPICVSYISRCGLPIRVQISAPQLSADGCEVIQEDEIFCDSGWRGAPECWTNTAGKKLCDFTAPGGLKGTPKGICKWSHKTRGVDHFFVTVRTDCRIDCGGGIAAEDYWKIIVKCGDCGEIEEDYSCCDVPTSRCVNIVRSRTYNFQSGCDPVDVYTVNVKIPASYTFPLKVRITGGVDDDLKVNDELIEESLYPFEPPFQLCNGAHCVGGGSAGTVIEITESPLKLTLVDNYRTNSGMDLTVCLDPDDEQGLRDCPEVENVSDDGGLWTAGEDDCCVPPSCPGDICRCNPLP